MKTYKKLATANAFIVLLFGAYLFSQIWMDYPKPVRTLILIIYMCIAILRAFLLFHYYGKNKK